VIELTEKASARVQEYYRTDSRLEGKFLRLLVEAGGCSGFTYSLTFDERKDEDEVHRVGEIDVLVDPQSSMYINGARIDWIESLSESGFSISNPQAKSSCGCGISFEL